MPSQRERALNNFFPRMIVRDDESKIKRMTPSALHRLRNAEIEVTRRRLLRESTPRLQVSLILLLSGLAGFLASFSLLHLELYSMTLRYPIAISVGYTVFLLLLRAWLWVQGRSLDVDPGAALDYVEPAADSFHGWGADFGSSSGGGSWRSSATHSSGGSAHGIDIGLDFEEFMFVIALIAIAAGLLASLYVVVIAPTLLAEILVDGLLLAGLYKRLAKIERRDWLQTAIRKTVLPAILVTLCFGVAGYALQTAVPDAHSIAEVWRQIK